MKKMLAIAVMALAALVLSAQPAAALTSSARPINNSVELVFIDMSSACRTTYFGTGAASIFSGLAKPSVSHGP